MKKTIIVHNLYYVLLDYHKQPLFKISEGFGSRMGEKQECCGALTGGIMVLSLLNSNGNSSNLSKSETYELATKLRNKFLDKYDIITCEVLKNIPLEGDYNICNDYIIETVELVNQIIEENNLL